MKVVDIVKEIELFAPTSLAESYDNCGLMVGSMEAPVSKLLLCVDVTPAIIEEAIHIGAEMIISHHPLIFSPIKKFVEKSDTERALLMLIKNDIALYTAHTSIDAAIGGVSFAFGKKLSLTNMEVLSVSHPGGEGYGVVGELAESMDYNLFISLLKEVTGMPYIKTTATLKKNIKRVALCGGSGADLLDNAIASGADIYISADFKYHAFFLAEKKIIIADIGHYESEKMVLDVFYDIIIKKYPNFAVCKTTLNSSPIIYL